MRSDLALPKVNVEIDGLMVGLFGSLGSLLLSLSLLMLTFGGKEGDESGETVCCCCSSF